ncbi:porin [Sphingomonas hankookensis]|uniref:porin n=1 Tax=Sphingomonas hankookensis TaxID=563996 RepID=UPI003D301CA8
MTLLATPAAALAQEQGRRNRDVFIASGEEDPLSIGDEDVYIDVAPFVEFDAGWSTASRDALIGPGDDQRARIGRGWLFFDYGLGSDVTGLAVVNFSNIDDTPLQYLWIDYQPTDRLTLRFGQQDANFSMQQRMGSRPALFADVAENGTLQAPAAVGVSILYGGDRFSIQAGVEGNDINDSPFGNGINLSGRATVAPWMQGRMRYTSAWRSPPATTGACHCPMPVRRERGSLMPARSRPTISARAAGRGQPMRRRRRPSAVSRCRANIPCYAPMRRNGPQRRCTAGISARCSS